MAGKISVDPAKLGTTAQQLADLSEEYARIYTQLLKEANSMGAAWDSADNAAYVQQINGCCQALKAMAGRLDDAGEVIKKEKSNYETIRDNNFEQVKNLAN
jgi:WXG100 family type VII secretion target